MGFPSRWVGVVSLAGVALLIAATTASAQTGTPPVNVPVTDGQFIGYQGQWVAANPAHSGDVAISYENGSNNSACYLATSTDSGTTWTNKVMFGPGGLFPITAPNTQCFHPSIAYAPDGTLYYALTLQNPTGHYPLPDIIELTTSTDGGTTFASPVLVDPSTTTVSDLNVRMAVDPVSKRLYVAFDRQAPYIRVYLTSSTDGGHTFSTATQVTPVNHQSELPSPSVGSDGKLYIAYQDATKFFATKGKKPFELNVISSSDAGTTFSAPVTALTQGSCFNKNFTCQKDAQGNYSFNPSSTAATGTVAGQLFVAGSSDISGTMRVVFASSQDGGATWSAATTIGIPSGGSSDHQLLPALAVDSQDKVNVVYYDLAQPSGLYNTFLVSAPAGGTFSTPAPLSSASSQEFYPFGIDPFAGGHLVAAVSGGVYAAWTDTRRGTVTNGKEDIFFATTVPATGVAGTTTTPAVSVPSTGSGALLGAGGGLMALGGAAALASQMARRRRRGQQAGTADSTGARR